MIRWWMVRAGDSNELIPEWISKGVVSIGWSELGNPKSFNSREKLIEKAHDVYKDEKPGARVIWASQVWKFCYEIKVNDKVITYARDTREYIIGTVTKEHVYDPAKISDYYPNVVEVAWEDKRILRDSLSQGAKNSLGGISTVFRVDQWEQEFEQLLNGNISVTTNEMEEDEESAQKNEEFIQQAKSMVEDTVDKLDPWQMQDLVAGLLVAMGYQVKVSPKGPDGGIDILAHRDAFGFEKPIIKVQVKHRRSASSSPEIQQLLGANPIGASCLFVSTGGFTSSAKNVAMQNGVKLIDLAELVELINEWYERFPMEAKSLIPLKRVYVPM